MKLKPKVLLSGLLWTLIFAVAPAISAALALIAGCDRVSLAAALGFGLFLDMFVGMYVSASTQGQNLADVFFEDDQ